MNKELEPVSTSIEEHCTIEEVKLALSNMNRDPEDILFRYQFDVIRLDDGCVVREDAIISKQYIQDEDTRRFINDRIKDAKLLEPMKQAFVSFGKDPNLLENKSDKVQKAIDVVNKTAEVIGNIIPVVMKD